jgi:hypothetical protein
MGIAQLMENDADRLGLARRLGILCLRLGGRRLSGLGDPADFPTARASPVFEREADFGHAGANPFGQRLERFCGLGAV